MADPTARLGIAENAQRLLLSQWTGDGRRAFAERFLDILKPAEAPRPTLREPAAALS